jgi:hypothetical protein
MIGQAADDAACDGFAACMARTNSPGPAPHFENTFNTKLDRLLCAGYAEITNFTE